MVGPWRPAVWNGIPQVYYKWDKTVTLPRTSTLPRQSLLISITVPGCNCPPNSTGVTCGKFFLLAHLYPFKGKGRFWTKKQKVQPSCWPLQIWYLDQVAGALTASHLAWVLRWTCSSPQDAGENRREGRDNGVRFREHESLLAGSTRTLENPSSLGNRK